MLRMRMQQEGDGSIGLLRMMVAAFKTAFRPIEYYFWHGSPRFRVSKSDIREDMSEMLMR